MAYREVFINSVGTTSSDLYNSGCPRTQVANSGTDVSKYGTIAITSGSAVATITCTSAGNATALVALLDTATAVGPCLLFVNDTVAATRNFAWFSAGQYAVVGATVVFTLTGGQLFGTTVSGLDWGVGGERATALSASSRRMFFRTATTGDLQRPTQTAGQSVRVVISRQHRESFTNANEWRVALRANFVSGTGGTQFHIVSEAYSSTPVAGRPVFTFTGNITTALIYEGADLEWDGGLLAGIDFVRATGTNAGGTGSCAALFYSHVRIIDCSFTCSAGASITGSWLFMNNGTGARGSGVYGCTIAGHTTNGIYGAAGTAQRYLDNTITGGTHGINMPAGSTWEAIITGNRIANCTTNGIIYGANGGAGGRGASSPAEISHNSILACGNGIKIDPGSATIPDYHLTFIQIRNNNIERCTVGITTAGTTDPAAAILEGLGVTIFGNNTGEGVSVCTTRYGTQADLLQQGDPRLNTGMAYTGTTFTTSAPATGIGGTAIGAGGLSSGSISARPLPGPARR